MADATPPPPPPDVPPLSLADVTPSALCALGQRPLLLTGSLVQALRQHFASAGQIEDPALKHLTWDGSDASPLAIESVTRWRPAVSGQRPAVVVRRGAISVEGLGINDELQGYYSADGNDYYVTYLRGSHTLFAIATEAGEAELLGAEVYRDLIQFGPELRRYLRLLKFKVAEIDQLHRLREAAGSYAVPVTVAYAFETVWTIAPNAPRLKRIELRTLLDGMA